MAKEICEIEVYSSYSPGLKDIEQCTHLFVIYWLHLGDRARLTATPPHDGREHGVFATRSPNRPNMCPGLAMGYRVARYVRERYPRSEDEELVWIAENKSCSVDALQALLGCTAGKGNLIIKDHGKQAFAFYSRDKAKAMRIYFKGDVFERMVC